MKNTTRTILLFAFTFSTQAQNWTSTGDNFTTGFVSRTGVRVKF